MRRNSARFQAVCLAVLLVGASAFAAQTATAGGSGSRRGRLDPTSYRARISRSRVKPATPRVVSASEAMKVIRSGSRVLLPTEAGTSQTLVNALVQRAGTLSGKRPVEVLHPASMVQYPKHDPKKLRVNALFINSGARRLVGNGLKVTPTYLSEIPNLLQRNLKPNVVVVRVSPPDSRGYVSTGPSAGVVADLLADPKVKVIAEVNPNVPRTRGATRLHQSHIDMMVKSSEPMPELKWGKSNLVDMAIGRNVAREVSNRATLQLGIGPLQTAVADQLAKRGKRLNRKGKNFRVRVRSEMIDDGLLTMANAGIISKSRDAVQVGFAVGTRKLYDFLGKDKRVKMVATRDINDVYKAGNRQKLHAINSAVAVDLYGQACSEMIPRTGADGKTRPVPYSGVGGQVDFFRAVQRSEGGKGFLTVRSSLFKKGKRLSTISLDLPTGLVVTTNRYDMDRVATEWGVAHLRGKSTVERAQALVRVAHPDFRAQLAKQGQDRFGGNPADWAAAAKVTRREHRMISFFDRSMLAGK